MFILALALLGVLSSVTSEFKSSIFSTTTKTKKKICWILLIYLFQGVSAQEDAEAVDSTDLSYEVGDELYEYYDYDEYYADEETPLNPLIGARAKKMTG